MKFDPSNNLPRTGRGESKILGVRVTGDHADIDLEPAGDIAGAALANGKGLSVNADWENLPHYRLPEELDDGRNGASGKSMKLYSLGEGAFAAVIINDCLEMCLKPDCEDAGVIAPTRAMPFYEYEAALHATRNDWRIEEPQ